MALRGLWFAAALAACTSSPEADGKSVTLLNVSYDATRELYTDLDAAFTAAYKQQTGVTVDIKQSHGGSGKQARAVIEGLEADVVSLATASDIDAIAAAGLTAKDWQSKFPANSTPYTSTIVFVVRAGNPKGIHDWADLAKPGVAVITTNPKTSGGARWAYVAAWSAAVADLGDTPAARARIAATYLNVPVLDSGARGATTTFTERQLGDVLVAWEAEARVVAAQAGGYELVVPPTSVLAEPPVAIVDAVAARHGTTAVAKAYLDFLYSDAAQAIIAKHYYRPHSTVAGAAFPALKLSTIADAGGWPAVQARHFADGGTYDAIFP